jgi:purine-binding chemotaxis protein CheW
MADGTQIETSQHLTFTLGKDVFALDIASVREVLELTPITKIPRTPDFLCGVINLRGHAVPVMDMRRKFGMPHASATVDTCIIIVEVGFEDERIVMGGLVDSVREVFEIHPDAMEAAPRMGTSISVEFIKGIGKQDKEFIIVLDIDRLFSAKELAAVQVAAGAKAESQAA